MALSETMPKKDVVILGASGLAKEVLWLLEENKNEWNILGFIDNCYGSIHGYNVIGNDEWLLKYNDPIHVVCAIGDSSLRKKVVSKFTDKSNIIFPNIISRDTALSDSVIMGKGCIVCSKNILTVDIELGDFTLINLACTVGHDVRIGDFVTVNPGVNISGNVTIKAEANVGTGASIIQGVTIGEKAIIGAGSVVIKDIPDSCTAVGRPAKVIKKG